jgi:NADPH:quinone reductase-like Zn-dependent oxidoreductase
MCPRYGGPEVLRLQDVARPVPRPDEVLVRVHATTVTSADSRIRAMRVPAGLGWLVRLALGVRRPRRPILGVVCSGVVEAMGVDVQDLKVGDAVFGIDSAAMGCHAEYKCFAAHKALVIKPPCLTHEEAAAIPFGGTTALHFLERSGLRYGETVLILGAAGAVGTALVQLARLRGAHVTAVCSAAKADLVRFLGAQTVIDHASTPVLDRPGRFDVIVDLMGTVSFRAARPHLHEHGRLLLLAASLGDLLAMPWWRLTTSQRVLAGAAPERREHLMALARLVQAGRYLPVIGQRLAFEQMALAHRVVDAGQGKGNLVITVPPAPVSRTRGTATGRGFQHNGTT